MPATLIPVVAPAEVWHDLSPAEGVTLAVLVRAPSWSDTFRDFAGSVHRADDDSPAATAAHFEGRVKAVVVDWRDVLDADGKPVPFTPDNLMSLCGQFPRLVPELVTLANRAFRPLETDRPNV